MVLTPELFSHQNLGVDLLGALPLNEKLGTLKKL
jgi:hypothetical protein